MQITVHTLIFGVALVLAAAEAIMHKSLLAGAVAFIALGLLVQA